MEIGLCRRQPAHPVQEPHGASLALDTVAHLRLPPDVPSRAHRGYATGEDLVTQIGALASSVSGSLHQGPGFGLAPPVCCACQAHCSASPLRGLAARAVRGVGAARAMGEAFHVEALTALLSAL